MTIVLLVGLLAGSSAANFALLQEESSLSEQANRMSTRAVNAEATQTSLKSRIDDLEKLSAQNPSTAAQSGMPDVAPGSAPATAQIDLIAQQLERVRGLRRTHTVPIKFQDQAALSQYSRQRFAQDFPPDQTDPMQKLLTTLGLLKPGEQLFDIAATILAADPALALYSDHDKTLYVTGSQTDTLSPSVQLAVAREYERALLDQTYDLGQLQPKPSENSDRAEAVHALIEGDLNVTQRLWAQQNIDAQVLAGAAQPDNNLLEDAPAIIRADHLFGPFAGQRFVDELYQRTDSFSGVDAAFKTPPVSTSHILHTDKYISHAQPLPVDLPDLSSVLGGGARQVGTNIMGEFDLFNVLAQDGDVAVAAAAVSGWQGDRWELLEHNGGHALVLRSLWESEKSAQDFFNAYVLSLKLRYASAHVEAESSHRLAQTGADVATELRVVGRDVLAVIAYDRPAAEAIVRALDH